MKNKSQLNLAYVWSICLVAACGGLLFGYDWVVIGGAKPFYEAYFGITNPSQSGWAMSSALAGCVVGAILSGTLSERFGRKRTLLLAAVMFTASAWGTATAHNFDIFVIFRIIGGIGIGLASALSPMYIAEVSPAEKRGTFVAVNQLTIVIGVLAAQLVNLMIAEPVTANASMAAIAQSWNGQLGWRWMFGSGAVPAVAFLILLFMVPESPRWLVKVGRFDQAEKVLAKIGSAEYARSMLAEILQSMDADDARRVRLPQLFARRVRPVMIIGIVLAVFQQWCGINVIFNYAQEIFASAGFDINDTLKSIVATGLINLIFTIIALPVLLLVLVAIAIYALTLAPVTWVLLSEIFPNRVRGMAMAVGTFSVWVACFLLTYSFPLLNAALGASGSFLLYGIICLAGFVFIWRKVPETKGVTLEALEQRFGDQAELDYAHHHAK